MIELKTVFQDFNLDTKLLLFRVFKNTICVQSDSIFEPSYDFGVCAIALLMKGMGHSCAWPSERKSRSK